MPSETMRITVLGSGTSTGVPVIGCRCSVCKSPHPRNHRTRASIALTLGDHNLLIDTSPEMRLQLVSAGIETIDAVLYTHLHADHSAGFDDLRAFYFRTRGALDVYLLPEYIPELKERFRYAFEDTGYQGATPRVLLHAMPTIPFALGPFAIEPVRLGHGHVSSCGFRFGRFAYATDFKNFPIEVADAWRGKVDVMVASGIHFGTHSSHSVIPETLALFDRIGVRHGILSHLAHDVDYVGHSPLLPPHVEFAFDGMTIDLEATVT